jgi:hypothetical protein
MREKASRRISPISKIRSFDLERVENSAFRDGRGVYEKGANHPGPMRMGQHENSYELNRAVGPACSVEAIIVVRPSVRQGLDASGMEPAPCPRSATVIET